MDEQALIEKLAATWHLNVPERQLLPEGRAKASLFLNAIVDELRDGGWYPAGVTPNDDFAGDLRRHRLPNFRFLLCRLVIWKHGGPFTMPESPSAMSRYPARL